MKRITLLTLLLLGGIFCSCKDSSVCGVRQILDRGCERRTNDDKRFDDSITKEEQVAISAFIVAVEKCKKKYVCSSIQYPVARKCPLPMINNEREFKSHYYEYFDTKTVSIISAGKWQHSGWRGIMCGDGEIWGDVIDGRFMVSSFGFETAAEKKAAKKAIDQSKRVLHPSVADFEEPLLAIETADFKVRIDRMSDGKIRYAAWRTADDFSAKPLLIINGGDYWEDGTIGYPYYMFKSSGYTYLVSFCGSYVLEVFKGVNIERDNLYETDPVLRQEADEIAFISL